MPQNASPPLRKIAPEKMIKHQLLLMGSYLEKIDRGVDQSFSLSCVKVVFNDLAKTLISELKSEESQAVDRLLSAGFVEILKEWVKRNDVDQVTTNPLCDIFDSIEKFYPDGPDMSDHTTGWPQMGQKDLKDHGRLEEVMKAAFKKFNALDVDHSGFIDGAELAGVVHWLWGSLHFHGEKITPKEQAVFTQRVLVVMDFDHDGKVSFVEFAAIFRRLKRREDDRMTLEEAREKFDQFDLDHNGAVEGKELVGIVEWLWGSLHAKDQKMTLRNREELIKSTLRVVDLDHDGKVTFTEFKALFMKMKERIDDGRAHEQSTPAVVAAVVAEPILDSNSTHAQKHHGGKHKRGKGSRARHHKQQHAHRHDKKLEQPAAAAAAEEALVDPISEKDQMHMRHMAHLVERARAKFNKLNLDQNGAIEAKELRKLVRWCFRTFHLHGIKLPARSQRKLCEDLTSSLGREHNNHKITFEEFERLFRKNAGEIGGFDEKVKAARAGGVLSGASKVAQAEAKAEAPRAPMGYQARLHAKHVDVVVSKAQRAFTRLDLDHNGAIEGAELVSLTEWLWDTLHFHGEKLSEQKKAHLGAMVVKQIEAEWGPGTKITFDKFETIFRKAVSKAQVMLQKDTAQVDDAAAARAAAVAVPSKGDDSRSGPAGSKECVKESNENMAVHDDASEYERRMLHRAHKKFNQFDRDHNGSIDQSELDRVIGWLWASSHMHGPALPEERKQHLMDHLLLAVDGDKDGKISFDEFYALFVQANKRIHALLEKERIAAPNAKEAAMRRLHAKHVAHLVRSAEKKFNKFDTNGDGCIGGDELGKVVEWMWGEFHVNGEKLTQAKQENFSKRLLAAVKAEDGRISLPQFKVLFLKTAARAKRHHMLHPDIKPKKDIQKTPLSPKKSPSPKKSAGPKKSPGRKARLHQAHVNNLVSVARKRFNELDRDGSGVLETDEIAGVAQWLFKTFHTHGEKLTETRQAQFEAGLLRTVDTDHDGTISFEEFELLFRRTAARLKKIE